MEWIYLVWGATHEAILKASSEAQNSFWIKNHTGEKIWDNFLQVQLIKLSRVLQVVRHRTWTVTEDILSICLYSKKVFALTAFARSWIVETIFDNVSTAKLPWLTQHNFVNSVDNVTKLSTLTGNWMSNKCVQFYIIPLCSSWKIS